MPFGGESPRLLAVGISNGTIINADVTNLGSAVAVVLTADYTTLEPPGFVTRPSCTGAGASNFDVPRTIISGTTLVLLGCEAGPLVSAGGATYL